MSEERPKYYPSNVPETDSEPSKFTIEQEKYPEEKFVGFHETDEDDEGYEEDIELEEEYDIDDHDYDEDELSDEDEEDSEEPNVREEIFTSDFVGFADIRRIRGIAIMNSPVNRFASRINTLLNRTAQEGNYLVEIVIPDDISEDDVNFLKLELDEGGYGVRITGHEPKRLVIEY